MGPIATCFVCFHRLSHLHPSHFPPPPKAFVGRVLHCTSKREPERSGRRCRAAKSGVPILTITVLGAFPCSRSISCRGGTRSGFTPTLCDLVALSVRSSRTILDDYGNPVQHVNRKLQSHLTRSSNIRISTPRRLFHAAL